MPDEAMWVWWTHVLAKSTILNSQDPGPPSQGHPKSYGTTSKRRRKGSPGFPCSLRRPRNRV